MDTERSGCQYKIVCNGKEFICDGTFCLREMVFSEGLPEMARRTLGVSIEEAKESASVEGNCQPAAS